MVKSLNNGNVILDITDREKIENAFVTLREKGYFAMQWHACCQTCGWAEIPEGECNRAVFYHYQSGERAFGSKTKKMLIEDLYLYWSGDGREIVDALINAGMSVRWDRDEFSSIIVLCTNK